MKVQITQAIIEASQFQADQVNCLLLSVINNQIIEFVYANHLIKFNQIGFRKGYRTADHVFVMKTLIDSDLNKGKKL